MSLHGPSSQCCNIPDQRHRRPRLAKKPFANIIYASVQPPRSERERKVMGKWKNSGVDLHSRIVRSIACFDYINEVDTLK